MLLALGVGPVALLAGCNNHPSCEPVEDKGSGIESCSDGYVHRTQAVECEELGPATQGGCTRDEHCMGSAYCACTIDGGVCVQTECRTDAECDEGHECASVADFSSGLDQPFLVCTTDEDECLVDDDCIGGGTTGASVASEGRCEYDGAKRYCYYPRPDNCGDCVDGRPFIVSGHNIRAELAGRADWLANTVGPLAIERAERQALADHWSDVGRMEHASIAAFARLALQLLALGAGPELVASATAAMQDETRHARIAFGLASSYAGEPLGPGPLPIDGALDGTDLETVVVLAIREGCVGETAAALAVQEGAAACRDERLSEILHQIAEDETAHAELAFKTVAWGLAIGGDRIRRVVAAELASLRAEAHAPPATEPSDDRLSSYGVVGDVRFAELRARAIVDLAIPLLDAALVERPAVHAAGAAFAR